MQAHGRSLFDQCTTVELVRLCVKQTVQDLSQLLNPGWEVTDSAKQQETTGALNKGEWFITQVDGTWIQGRHTSSRLWSMVSGCSKPSNTLRS